MAERSVVLLGGGLDSLAALEYSLEFSRPVRLFHFAYGNVVIGPGYAAQQIADSYRIELQDIDLGVDWDGILPTHYADGLLHSEDGVSQYLPDRNLLFLAVVSAWVKSEFRVPGKLGTETVCYTGFSIGAPSIYDITPEFVTAINAVYALDRQVQFRVEAPFVTWNKAQVLQYLLEHGAPIELTYTCYLGEKIQCGECVTCVRRIEAFKELDLIDPVPYKAAIDWTGCEAYDPGSQVEYEGA